MASPGIPALQVMGPGIGNALRKRRRRPTLEPMGSEGNVPRPIRLSARITADLHNNALVSFPGVKSQAQAITRLLSNAAEGEASLLHPARAGVASAGHRGAPSAEPEETREEVPDGRSRRRDRRALPRGIAVRALRSSSGRETDSFPGTATEKPNRAGRDGGERIARPEPAPRPAGRDPGCGKRRYCSEVTERGTVFCFFGHAFPALSGAVRCWGF